MKPIQEFKDLLGTLLINIEKTSDEMIFSLDDGRKFKLFHSQNCCECVQIEDVCGDLEDLLNTPITLAEESTSEEKQDGQEDWYDSFTWTFYKLATAKGYVTVRWLGRSNGYYSERVDFEEVKLNQH